MLEQQHDLRQNETKMFQGFFLRENKQKISFSRIISTIVNHNNASSFFRY